MEVDAVLRNADGAESVREDVEKSVHLRSAGHG